MTASMPSKRVRDQAALICAMAASSGGSGLLDGIQWLRDVLLTRDSFDEDPVFRLATSAFYAARAATETPDGWQRWTEQMAEAEAMLRTGWSP